MARESIKSPRAPRAIGAYSQAVRAGNTVYISGQIPLHPETMELITDSVDQQIRRVFENLAAIAEAAGGTLSDIVKLTVYLVDQGDYAALNRVMAEYFREPYPARAVVGAVSLPRNSRLEMDAVLVLPD
jgi:reactive intermediate/imine deaminase